MAEQMEPFRGLRLRPLPEIGARAGDWIDIDLSSNPPALVLMRRIPPSEVELIRRHMRDVGRFLSRLPHREPVEPIGRPRLEVHRG